MTSQDPGPKGPGQFRMIIKKLQATSTKRQASSLTSNKPHDTNRIIKEKL